MKLSLEIGTLFKSVNFCDKKTGEDESFIVILNSNSTDYFLILIYGISLKGVKVLTFSLPFYPENRSYGFLSYEINSTSDSSTPSF